MIRTLLSYLYKLGLNLWYFYDENFRVKDVLPAKVISIGNITLGGSGKTPLTLHIAKKLAKERKVAILSRGYRRKGKGLMVLYGEHAFLDWKMVGDEPYLMYKKLQGQIPIIVEKDRYEAGRLAIKQFNANTLILDDGFQYLPLKRDIDIVCINQKTVLNGDFLFPKGTLREEFSSLNRAHIIVVNLKAEALNPLTLEYLEKWKKPTFIMRYKPVRFYNFEGQQFSLQGLRGFDIAVVTGIADPNSFIEILRGLNLSPKETVILRDHDTLPLAKLRALTDKYDFIITTEKDLIKYPIQKKLLALEIDVELENEERLLSLL
ncbi:MAG: tetraacyldisaccharide 4'-kinase [Candidatus Hydrothermia bacterium]